MSQTLKTCHERSGHTCMLRKGRGDRKKPFRFLHDWRFTANRCTHPQCTAWDACPAVMRADLRLWRDEDRREFGYRQSFVTLRRLGDNVYSLAYALLEGILAMQIAKQQRRHQTPPAGSSGEGRETRTSRATPRRLIRFAAVA
jgi:hypothetical protein